MRVCSVAGCPTIYKGTATRCPTHQATAERRHRDNNRGYRSAAHKQFRAAVLLRDPLCAFGCGHKSTVADHHPHSRKTLIDMGLDPNDPRYGRGLCKPHHDSETAKHQPGGWNAR